MRSLPGIFRGYTVPDFAYGAIAVTPVLMVPARGITPAMLLIVAMILGVSIVMERRRADFLRTLRVFSGWPALATAGFALLAAVSLTWTAAFAHGSEDYIKLSGTAALAAVALAGAHVFALRVEARVACAAIIVTSILVALDVTSDGALRGSVGLSPDSFRLNRASVAIVLMAPLVTFLLLGEHRGSWVPALWVAVLVGAFTSESSSAQLALVVVGLTLPLALASPGKVHRFTLFVALAGLITAPIVTPIANDLIPQAVHDFVGYSSLTIRGEIWREYMAIYPQRPLLGYGLESSFAAAHLPIAASLSDAERALLDWAHPHNMAVQVWFELGAVGAAFVAVILFGLFRAIGRIAEPLLPYATATTAGSYAVCYVSHGAWQTWWWSLIALIATGFVATSASLASRNSQKI